MRKAGQNNKTKFQNYFLIYHGGWVVAMVLDHDIRKRTKEQACLDDLMRWMYLHFPRDKSLYQAKDILVGLASIVDYDYTPFYDKYINGKKTIPVSNYLPLSDALWAFEVKKHDQIKYRSLYNTLGFNVTH